MTRFARRHTRLLALVAASLVAAAVVAGTSLATSATSSGPSGSVLTATTSTTVPGTVAGAALQQTFVNVVRAVSPSVVQIEDRTGLGSGIVLDSGGDIVTNNHVVTGATAFTVTTSTGKRYPARLVGAFPPDDLAVIRVSGARRKPATFADSSALQVGDIALAIGNPLGLQSSVTEGIVSASARRRRRGDRHAAVGDPDQRAPSTRVTRAARWSTSRGTSSASRRSPRPTPRSAAALRASASRSRVTSSRTSPDRSSRTARSSTRIAPISASKSGRPQTASTSAASPPEGRPPRRASGRGT